MKFGLFGGALAGNATSIDSNGYDQFIDYILEADALGFHSSFVVEHHFTGIGQVSATLNLLSYLAARTTRIRLATGVTVLPWHNPALLAEQITTLDLLSKGRVDVGVGKGYRPYEFSGFDIAQDEAQERYDEALDFLLKAWTSTERFSHSGKYWTFNDVVVEPAPTQQPHPPLWVGAGSVASIEKAAGRGFSLLLDMWAPDHQIIDRLRVYEAACAKAGRPFRADQVGVCRAIQITRTEEEREAAIALRAKVVLESGALKGGAFALPPGFSEVSPAAARAFAEQAAIVGCPEEIIERLKSLQAAGVDYVLLSDASSSIPALREFADEIMVHFRQSDLSAAAA